MMSASDSEEFASADEDVEEEQKKTEKDKLTSNKDKCESGAATTAIQRQPCGGLAKDEDETKDARKALDALVSKTSQEAPASSGGWGFGGWGSSLLSTARSSVSTLTTQLGDGINVVMETVESALDVPPPEELDKTDEEEKKEEKAAVEEKDDAGNEGELGTTGEAGKEEETGKEKGDGSWWSAGWGVTSSVVTSGRSLMSGGLDVLETIGKRTMEVLHETDPGLSRTKSLLRSGRTPGSTLSQALREARQKHEEECQREEKWEEERKGHFGAQFEDCQGMAHLEALEMLSSQCEARLHSQLNRLSGDDLAARKRALVAIKLHFEDVEDEEEEEDEDERKEKATVRADVKEALKPFQLSAAQEILRIHEEVEERLKGAGGVSADEEDSDKILQAVNQTGIQLLALLSSSWVGLFHKAGELALAGGLKFREKDEEGEMTATQASELLVKCALVASQDISCLGEEVADLLRKHLPQDTETQEGQRRLSTQLVTGIYLETGNSRAYVRDAFVLLLPVLQLAACN